MDGALYDVVETVDGPLTVHPASACADRDYGCPIHAPSDHPLRLAPLRWWGNRAVLERICVHGAGHPDPDQAEYERRVHGRDIRGHACDGCCCAKT